MELGLRVRDNTRAGFVKPRESGTLRGIHVFRGVGERGPRVTRGHVAWKSTHGAWVWRAAWTPRGFESGTSGLKSTHGGVDLARRVDAAWKRVSSAVLTLLVTSSTI